MTTAPSAAATSDLVHERRWWTLGVLCLSLLIVFVGNSSLNVALPTLSEDLHATNAQLQWVVAAYSLVFAGLLFSTGALGDRYLAAEWTCGGDAGRRWVVLDGPGRDQVHLRAALSVA